MGVFVTAATVQA